MSENLRVVTLDSCQNFVFFKEFNVQHFLRLLRDRGAFPISHAFFSSRPLYQTMIRQSPGRVEGLV
jgi:hypothetical protein